MASSFRKSSSSSRTRILFGSLVVASALATVLLLAAPAPSLAQNQSYPEKILYTFTGGADGGFPLGAFVHGHAETPMYGATLGGGAFGFGTLFELSANGTETVLASFNGRAQGGSPAGPLASGAFGSFDGVAEQGGDAACRSGGCGTVFQVSPGGVVKTLYAFTGGSDGSLPVAGLATDPAGNLYGSTFFGGGMSCNFPHGCGVVFRISPGGAETILHRFAGPDGAFPYGSLFRDPMGNLYGATQGGGAHNGGTVFEITAGGQFKQLYSFSATGVADGTVPAGGVVRDFLGNIYGATVYGGASSRGAVFQLTSGGV
jgi:uncharacterized repeat protein (TIGR03803 family)